MKFKSKILPFLFIIFGFNFTSGQTAAVKFEVKIPSEGLNKNASIFLAGSFNCWNPQDSLYMMKKIEDDLYSIIIPVFDGVKYEYKYVKDNWNSVEVDLNGHDIKNRKMISKDGLIIEDTVLNWKQPPAAQQMDTAQFLNKEQMNEIAKLKDDMQSKLDSRLKNILGILKSAMNNMLSANPDMKLKEKYHNKIVENINSVLDSFSDALWKVSSLLSPEQKKAILEEMKKTNIPGDIFNMMTKGMK